MELESRRQGHDLGVPISTLAHPDLDADDVDAVDPARVLGSDSDSANLDIQHH